MKMYRLWIEWDFGQDDVVFTSEDRAKDWLQSVIEADEHLMEEECWESGLDILDAGLAGIQELEVR